MITLALDPANTELAFLIDQIEHGETITLTKDGKPVAQIFPFTQNSSECGRQLGSVRVGMMKGLIDVPDDFDDPLPDDLLDLFEGKGKPPYPDANF
jgi:antitoxin (DNA-binding transcriptional repressor) of toxin-antitoxin stability system